MPQKLNFEQVVSIAKKRKNFNARKNLAKSKGNVSWEDCKTNHFCNVIGNEEKKDIYKEEYLMDTGKGHQDPPTFLYVPSRNLLRVQIIRAWYIKDVDRFVEDQYLLTLKNQ